MRQQAHHVLEGDDSWVLACLCFAGRQNEAISNGEQATKQPWQSHALAAGPVQLQEV